MNTWDLFSFRPNTTYKATLYDIQHTGSFSDRDFPMDEWTVYSEFSTGSNGEIAEIAENPLAPDAFTLQQYQIRSIKDEKTGEEVDLGFFAAVCSNSLQLAKKCIAENVNMDLRLKQDTSALHIGAIKGRIDILRAMIDAGAEVDSTDSLGWTPMFLAVKFEQHDTVTFLHDRGASTTAVIGGQRRTLGSNKG